MTNNNPYSALSDNAIPSDNLARVDKRICLSLESFINDLDEVESFILKSRFGFDKDYLTLQATGVELHELYSIERKDGELRSDPYTRERVRQIQGSLIERWRKEFLLIDDLLAIISQGYNLLNNDFMIGLRSHFAGDDSEKHFNRFLAAAAGVHESVIQDIAMPHVPINVIDEFWINYFPGEDKTALDIIDDIYTYCNSRYLGKFLGKGKKDDGTRLNMLQVRNLVYQLIQKGGLNYSTETDKLYPVSLSKAYGISYATHAFPNGAGWKVIQQLVNDLGACSKRLSETRLDYATGTAVDNKWIYQSDRGSYAPYALFLEGLNGQDPHDVIERIKDILIEELGYVGSTALSSFYYQHKEAIGINDYYVVRHLIRESGEEQYVYFQGLSGSDMVSLEEDIKTKSKQDVILEKFQDSTGFKVEDVVPLLRSNSLRHASYLIDTLLREGKITKFDKGVYVCTGDMNKDLDIPAIMKSVQSILRGVNGAQVAYDDLFEKVAVDLNETDIKNAGHLSSIIRSNFSDYDGDWHFSVNYISVT